MNWTPSQNEAISARNPSVLVSAAAGSGKTTVLLERVTQLLKEGYDLSEMLIVTFTRAAAAELKAKLMAKLDESEDEQLRKQALYVNRADICTIHVFCSRLIREYFHVSGIDPLSAVGDTGLMDDELSKARDDVLEEAYDHPSEDENALFSSYSTDQILEALKILRSFLNARADGDDWTEKALNNNSLSKYTDEIKKYILLLPHLAMRYLHLCDQVLNLPNAPEHYGETLREDIELVNTIIEGAKNGIFRPPVKPSELSRKKIPAESQAAADQYKALRDKFKNVLNKYFEFFPENPEQAQQDIDFTLPSLRALVSLNKRIEDRYTKEKRRRNQLDYGDLEHIALKTLDDETVRADVQRRYRAIFVDEYQDVSALQEAIFRKITCERTLLFMVGDVKQSIYRFRQAEPTLFREKYENFSDDRDAKERRVILQQNFRSTSNILTCVNAVFAHAMRKEATELNYDEKAMLRPKECAEQGEPCELAIIKGVTDEESEESERISNGYKYEAAYIAERISELVKTGLRQDDGTVSPVKYSDIVILIRNTSGRAPEISKILTDRGIPVFCDATDSFFELPEVSDVLNILQVLVNPYQDIPLIAALHSPCFGFTETELTQLKLTNMKSKHPFHKIFYDAAALDTDLGKKVSDCVKTLENWRFLSHHISVSGLISMIIDEAGLYSRAGTLRNGELRQANMRLLCEKADGLADPYDLGAFLRLVKIAKGSDDKSGAKSIGENENVVRIMTIHKSKGLEFPVVFVMELARKFKNNTDRLIADPDVGMALSYINGDLRVKKNSYATRCLKYIKAWHNRAEECRLLYVAMTRAKKKLILLCSLDKAENHMAFWKLPAENYTANSAERMSDWIGQVLQDGLEIDLDREFTDPLGGMWKVSWHDVQDDLFIAPAETETNSEENDFISDETVYWMNRKPVTGDLLKTSVTSVSKRIKSEDDMEETPVKKRMIRPVTPRPGFLNPDKELTAAEKGTAVHKALGCIGYDFVRNGQIEEGLQELFRQGLLTEKEMNCIQPDKIRAFYQSEVGTGALKSENVRREWQFVLKLENFSILQGVIDLCYMENGSWVLADYKTDHIGEEELAERYKTQINLYRIALEKITGIPVSKICLYSLVMNKEIPLPVFDPEIRGTIKS